MVFSCEICRKEFAQKISLVKHQNKIKPCSPNDLKLKIKCSTCNKLFSSKSNLQAHMLKKSCYKNEPDNEINDEKTNINGSCNDKNDNADNAVALFHSIPKDVLQNALSEMLEKLVQPNTTNNKLINSNNMQNISANNTQNIENSNNTMNNMSAACLINYVINNYPNAKNIEDCIKIENIPRSILIDCEDYYFNEGAMIIFKGLCDIGEENRPIHCTDASRGNYIYKTNDVWKIDVGGEAIRTYFFPVIQDAYTQVHKKRIKNNPGNSTIIGNFLTEMTSINVKKICQKTLKRLSNDFLAKNSKNSKMIKDQEKSKKTVKIKKIELKK